MQEEQQHNPAPPAAADSPAGDAAAGPGASAAPLAANAAQASSAGVAPPDAAAGRAGPPAPLQRRRTALRDYAESLLVTVLLALFGTSFVVQAFKIPSPSMENSLLVGDHLLVNKFVYGGRGGALDRLLPYRDVQRGDIIVFRFPFDDHTHYVKRVVAVPGDRLRIIDQQLYINGEAVSEPYKVHDPSVYDPFADNFPPPGRIFSHRNVRAEWATMLPFHVEKGALVIPPGKYFVMGDNRDRSWDSRFWGFVDRESIMGQPLMVYWSVDATEEDYSDRSAYGRLLGLAHTIVHFPAKTRWNRMMRTVR